MTTKEQRQAINRRHYLKNRDRYKAEKLAYYHTEYKQRIDPAKRAAYYKKWRTDNPEKARKTPAQAARHYRKFKQRYADDPMVHARKNASAKKWGDANPDKVRAARRVKKYGLNQVTFDILFSAQKGGCAICGVKEGHQFPHVDHCHATGRVRGLLCQKCNRGLGLFNDDPARMRVAAAYLERDKSS